MAGYGWNVLTNAWGSSKLRPGIDYILTMDVDPLNYVDGTELSWAYGAVPNTPWPVVMAFPEVMFGPSPKGDLYNAADTTKSLPVQVKDINSFVSNYDVQYGGNRAGFNVSYDLFFTSTPYGGSKTITNELMIWLSKGGIGTFGTNLGYYTDGTFSGDLFYNAASHYIAFVSRTDMTSGTVDIGAMIKTLEGLGIMSDSEYFETFQLGSEVIGGAGYLKINSLDADIVTKGINGPAQEKLIQGTGAVVTAAPADGGSTSTGTFDVAPTHLTLTGNYVKERQAVGAAAGMLTATDPEGQALSYSMVDDNGGRFSIDSKTGQITTNQTLYYADAISRKVIIRVTDAGGAYVDGTFWIAIAKVNQPPTNLAINNSSVVENSPIGTVVGTALAKDPQGSALTYSMVTSMGAFAIDSRTGVVTTTAAMNYESRSSFTITVRATDTFGLYVDQVLTIGVIDINEAPKKLVLDNDQVTERQGAGTLVGTVVGTDPDAGDVLSYSLTDTSGGPFAIDAKTGALTTTAPLDYDAQHSYSVTVRATDTGGLYLDKTYKVTVDKAPVDQAPTALTIDTASIDDRQVAGALVGTVTGVDPDKDALTYSIVGDNASFAIDAKTGAVTTKAALAAATYALTVRATDPGGLFIDQALSIAVTHVNQAPTSLSVDNVSIVAGQAAGTLIGNAKAVDPEKAALSYSLVGSNVPFAIDPTTGAITTTSSLGVADYAVTVRATDPGGLYIDKALTLSITRNPLISGGPGNDVLTGTLGNDVLNGGAGADVMTGGDGDDSYYVDNVGDQVNETWNNGKGGTDTVYAAIDYTLPFNVENLVLTGSANLNGTGGVNSNVITGNSGDNVLTGLAGYDTLYGGAGNDTLSGGADNDTLYGGAGNDVLDGGTGADIMWGGDGDDSYYVDNVADQVLEVYNNGLGGTDTVYSSVSYTTPGSVENLTLTGAADINATGGVNNNVLTGNSGNNVLTGGGGFDTLIGGAGIDTAWYAGKSTGYQVKTVYGKLTVVDTDTSDGNDATDTLSQIEKIYFAGDKVTMSVVSPIILDLSGKGVSLTSMSQSGASFDMDGDGKADKTAWFGKGSALLFVDRNGDGTLTDASEMSFTDDKAGSASDLDGLTSFDSNHDGVLSAADSQFASFKLFVDANGDGKVEAGEVKTLADLGVASITLAGTATNATWKAGDAMVLNTGSFTFTDGHTGSFDDVALSYQASTVQAAAQSLAEATSAFTAVAATIDPVGYDDYKTHQLVPLIARQAY